MHCLPARYALLIFTLYAASPLIAETYPAWCTLHFTPTQTADGLASPVRDIDLDGLSNLLEYFADTDPWDQASALQLTPGDAPESIAFPMALDRSDVEYLLLVTPDLVSWSETAHLLCAGTQVSWSLNGNSFAKLGVKRRPGSMIDSDQDGLDDFFEESLVDADPNDAFTHIGEIHPGDDFDGDGTDNLDEDANAAEPPFGGSFAKPALVTPGDLACLLDAIAPAPPAGLVVHTPLR